MPKLKIAKDNKMRWYGTEDNGKIKINKKLHKKYKESMLDTLKHELLHKHHPKMKEKTVRNKTKQAIKRMSKAQKKKLYSMLPK